MKKVLIILLTTVVSFTAFAQNDEDEVLDSIDRNREERENRRERSSDVQDRNERYRNSEYRTLFGHNRIGGVYCSFTGGYSEIENENAVLFGARFGWMAGHSFGVGFGATGFINEYHYEPSLDLDIFLTGGYGGIYLEPVVLPKFPVHLSFPVLLGAGGISYITRDEIENSNFIEDSEAFLLLEPGAEVELNLTRFMRFSAGASYRLPTSFDVGLSEAPGVRASSIRGLTCTVSLKFGRF